MDRILHRGNSTLTLTLTPEGERVVVKKSARPEWTELLVNEERIGRLLSEVASARPVLGMEQRDGTPVLLLAYVDGAALNQWRVEANPSLADRLKVAEAIARALAAVHEAGIIHRDVSPGNILVTSNGGVQLIDFAVATTRTQETAHFQWISSIIGTLAYMAPEQTGRINRSVDERSDLYGLGAVFYEMFTGERPFVAGDSLELIHLHLAQPPLPLHERNPEVPGQLSRIVLKLLAKNSEDRYRTALGLAADLAACRQMLAGTGRIEAFELARADASEKLQIPEKLYGREPEITELVAAFGAEILSEDGTISRKKLGSIVFSDPDRLAELNGISHPRMAARIAQEIESARLRGNEGRPPLIVLDAAILFEAGWHALCDEVWTVEAPPEVAVARLVERKHMTPEQARARLAAQMSNAGRARRARRVIRNEGSMEALRREVGRLWSDAVEPGN